jgi:putative molybdopterin biosynthesis protein
MSPTLNIAHAPPAPQLLTKREAGRELSVSERTVHSLITQGLLPVVRFGGNVRIDRADLEAFIQRQKTGQSHG